MNHRSVHRFALALLSLVTLFIAPLSAEGNDLWGAKAAAADPAYSLDDMLRYAIQDEYLARAEYIAIMGRFGEIRPFSNIRQAEENHIAWLAEIYGDLRLPLPQDNAASHVLVPDTLKAALEAGVSAEIDNIAMYESFLASPIIAKPENASIRTLFIKLRDASKNHLAAFRNGLAKY